MLENNCYLCGNEVIWQCDYSFDEVGIGDEDDGIVSIYSCPRCGAHIEVYKSEKEEE